MDRRFGLKPTSTAFAGAGALLASSWAMPLNLSAESNPERATNAASRDAKAPSVAEGPALSTNQGVRIPDDDKFPKGRRTAANAAGRLSLSGEDDALRP
jgi:hypothetical protein